MNLLIQQGDLRSMTQASFGIDARGSPILDAALQEGEPTIRLSPPSEGCNDHTTEAAIHELVSSGKVEELWDLFNNMDEMRA